MKMEESFEVPSSMSRHIFLEQARSNPANGDNPGTSDLRITLIGLRSFDCNGRSSIGEAVVSFHGRRADFGPSRFQRITRTNLTGRVVARFVRMKDSYKRGSNNLTDSMNLHY